MKALPIVLLSLSVLVMYAIVALHQRSIDRLTDIAEMLHARIEKLEKK